MVAELQQSPRSSSAAANEHDGESRSVMLRLGDVQPTLFDAASASCPFVHPILPVSAST